MHRYTTQTGAALIMLLGIMATLAIVCGMLAFVIQNQQSATASERSRTQAVYANEGALDSAIQMTKVANPMPTASPATPWVTDAELAAAFSSEFPDDATVTYRVYDNLATVDDTVTWDSNADSRMWVEATVTFMKKTSRMRVLVQQMRLPFAAALPKAVTYSDTGIRLEDTSDIYAVNADGTPDATGAPYITAISAGGTWTTSTSPSWAEVGRFTVNATSDLAAPGSSVQSLGIRANGSVSLNGTIRTSAPTHVITGGGKTFNDVTIAPETIGFLSDYFDQAAQTSLANEAQSGRTPATAPTAPTAPAPWSYNASTWTQITSALRTTIQNGSYTAAADLYQTTATSSGHLTLGNGTATRTYSFRNLYVAGNLTINGPVTFSATSLYVGGTLTITGPTGSTVPVAITNTLYINGTGTSFVRDRATLSAAAVYCGGSLELRNTTTTTVAHTIPQIYVVGNVSVPVGGSSPTYTARVALNVSSSLYAGGSITLNAPSSGAISDTIAQLYAVRDVIVRARTLTASSLYGGRDITLGGPSSGTVTHTIGLIYAAGTTYVSPTDYDSGVRNTLLFSGNVIVLARAVTTYCHEFTISGATIIPLKHWLGAVYVYAKSSTSDESLNRGTINWGGTASVTSRDHTLQADPASQAAQPKPMWLGRLFTRTGTYDDEYGMVWVPGNSGLSVDFASTGVSTVLCPLLCTTERTRTRGAVTFGSTTRPMVYFFMCDNNGIYPQVVDWGSTGTYYGLMIINESTINFWGDTTPSTPTVVGAVFAGCPYDPSRTSTTYRRGVQTTPMSQSDIVLQDACSIAYNQTVVGTISTSSLKTTTTVTQTVPGSWQTLPVD